MFWALAGNDKKLINAAAMNATSPTMSLGTLKGHLPCKVRLHGYCFDTVSFIMVWGIMVDKKTSTSETGRIAVLFCQSFDTAMVKR